MHILNFFRTVTSTNHFLYDAVSETWQASGESSDAKVLFSKLKAARGGQ